MACISSARKKYTVGIGEFPVYKKSLATNPAFGDCSAMQILEKTEAQFVALLAQMEPDTFAAFLLAVKPDLEEMCGQGRSSPACARQKGNDRHSTAPALPRRAHRQTDPRQ